MGAVRIRWRALARVAVIAVAGIAALQALPDLLKPPAPPPLARDVGLPRVAALPKQSRGSLRTLEVQKEPRDRERQRAGAGRALPPDVISSVPHRHVKRKPRRESEPSRTKPRPPRATVLTPSPPAPEPPTSPPASIPIEPPPPPAPSATPPAPTDGSEEFAPH
jgi:hypothetical protein